MLHSIYFGPVWEIAICCICGTVPATLLNLMARSRRGMVSLKSGEGVPYLSHVLAEYNAVDNELIFVYYDPRVPVGPNMHA